MMVLVAIEVVGKCQLLLNFGMDFLESLQRERAQAENKPHDHRTSLQNVFQFVSIVAIRVVKIS